MKKLEIYIEINDKIDSRSLYRELEHTGANVTDLGAYTLIYGTIQAEKLTEVLETCNKYGEPIATITPARQ